MLDDWLNADRFEFAHVLYGIIRIQKNGLKKRQQLILILNHTQMKS